MFSYDLLSLLRVKRSLKFLTLKIYVYLHKYEDTLSLVKADVRSVRV